jgi:2-amino-4-hydroxy-6-hydroxymethyldihydropteridine diphosphokinase
MSLVLLGIGSNQGDRLQYLYQAKADISEYIGSDIISSPIYETEPWGFESKNFFLNQVLWVKTALSPQQIIYNINRIEERTGRSRSGVKYKDRIIDIDLLLYDDLIISEDGLNIPHPQMHLRRFVLQPMSDIAGEIMHPVLNKNINSLLAECSDRSKVELYPV